MLLPAKFQTTTPAALGAKVVAMPPAPKPHVHQWVSVPDSKIHSRCAECGTVTLTEIVAPKVSFCPDDTHVAARLTAGAGQWVVGFDPASPDGGCSAVSVFAATAGGARFLEGINIAPTLEDALQAARDFFAKGGEKAAVGKILASFGSDCVAHLDNAYFGRFIERVKALTAKHYTSITAPDGKVRMVETDAEGWIKNDGTQPVADDVRVLCKYANGVHGCLSLRAGSREWADSKRANPITHWRLAA